MDIKEESNSYPSPKAFNSPKYTHETWLKVRCDYEAGNYTSQQELAERYGINAQTLRNRIINQKWNQIKQESERLLLDRVGEIKESEAEKYLKRTAKRMLRYEKIIDVSQKQLANDVENGIPIMDSEALNDYTLAESRIHEIAKSALRIPDVRQGIDITSKGQSLGESLVSAIAKLRDNQELPVLSDSEKQKIREADIVE